MRKYILYAGLLSGLAAAAFGLMLADPVQAVPGAAGDALTMQSADSAGASSPALAVDSASAAFPALAADSAGAAFSALGADSAGAAFTALGADSSGFLKTMAIGPGLVNLSPADQYATYQWGLKNDGELRLVEMKANFKSLDEMYRKRVASGRSGSIGIPNLGPGDFDSTITDAVTGIDINIRPAWDLYDAAENKRQVVVAIIDTGVDYTHQELSNAMWTNSGEIPGDGIDNDGNGYVDDIYGWNFYSGSNAVFVGEEDSHGTHAAGTISAVRGSYGITGITDNQYVKIMSLKALGSIYGIGSPESVIEAIRYAEANGASICNLSMGTTAYSEELAKVIQDSHMLFVVASGNGGSNGIGYNTDIFPVYPASFPYDNVISVANLLFDGSLSKDSNYGPASVDLAAPGTYILSTVPGNNYGFMSGTSMAAPMVTGAAAMLYSYRPELTLPDVKNILLNSARKLDTLNGKTVSGGMLDVYAALSYQP